MIWPAKTHLADIQNELHAHEHLFVWQQDESKTRKLSSTLDKKNKTPFKNGSLTVKNSSSTSQVKRLKKESWEELECRIKMSSCILVHKCSKCGAYEIVMQQFNFLDSFFKLEFKEETQSLNHKFHCSTEPGFKHNSWNNLSSIRHPPRMGHVKIKLTFDLIFQQFSCWCYFDASSPTLPTSVTPFPLNMAIGLIPQLAINVNWPHHTNLLQTTNIYASVDNEGFRTCLRGQTENCTVPLHKVQRRLSKLQLSRSVS